MTPSQLAYDLGDFLGLTLLWKLPTVSCPGVGACADLASLHWALMGIPGRLGAEQAVCLGLNLAATLCPSLTF